MKKLIVIFLILLLPSPAFAWQSAWRQPWGGGGTQLAIKARPTDAVVVNGSDTVTTGVTALSAYLSGAPMISDKNTVAITSATEITAVKIYIGANMTSANAARKFIFFTARPAAVGGLTAPTIVAQCVLDTAETITAGTLTYELSTPINAQVGDLPGIYLQHYVPSGDWIKFDTKGDFNKMFQGLGAANRDLFDYTSYFDSTYTGSYSITCYGRAADVGLMAASFGAGWGGADSANLISFAKNEMTIPTAPYASTVPFIYHFSNHLGMVYQNLSACGDTTTEMLERFDGAPTDMIARKFNYIIIDGGSNDIVFNLFSPPWTDDTITTLVANLEAMIEKCETANIIPVVLAQLPFAIEVEEIIAGAAQHIFDANIAIKAMVSTHPTAIYCDNTAALGYLLDGLWYAGDLVSADGSHWTAAGYKVIGEGIASAFWRRNERPASWARRW